MMWFVEGGPSMYAILGTDVMLALAGFAMLLMAIGARFVRPLLWPARILALLLLLATVLPLLEGGVGWYLGMQQLERAVEHAADQEMKDQLRAMGEQIAMIPVWFGLGSTVALGFGALLPLAIAAFPAGDPQD